MAERSKGPTRRFDARQPTSVDADIGRLIRERRGELGLNLQQLADRVGIAVQQLQKYETGENRVAASRLVEIARELGVPVAWFFEASGGTSEPQKPSRKGASAAIELLTAFDELSAEAQVKLLEIARLLRS